MDKQTEHGPGYKLGQAIAAALVITIAGVIIVGIIVAAFRLFTL